MSFGVQDLFLLLLVYCLDIIASFLPIDGQQVRRGRRNCDMCNTETRSWRRGRSMCNVMLDCSNRIELEKLPMILKWQFLLYYHVVAKVVINVWHPWLPVPWFARITACAIPLYTCQKGFRDLGCPFFFCLLSLALSIDFKLISLLIHITCMTRTPVDIGNRMPTQTNLSKG